MRSSSSTASQPALSVVTGSDKPDLFWITLGQLLDQQAAQYGHKNALLGGLTNARLIFEELCPRSKVLANGLLAMGVRQGDQVAILFGDDEGFVEPFFAVARIDVVFGCMFLSAMEFGDEE
ncbi:hypothetical protein BKA56DRAFT_665869 [Ilyonectria sp. MPI-CAGE-AT-0026]|nr:hypothetical protein BKA56DRAFT_665869 [Ilyonectria sp. MPI-CAGE-AT-0026]